MAEEETQTQDTKENTEAVENNDSLLSMQNEDTAPVEIKEGEKPEFLPEELWDADNKQVKLNDLLKAYEADNKRMKGLRDKLAKGGKSEAPKSIDEYDLKYGEQDFTDDEVYRFAREAALEAGVSKDAFSKFMNKFLGATAEWSGTPLTEEQKQAQYDAHLKAEYAKLGTNATAIVRSVVNWRDNLVAEGYLDKEQAEIMTNLATSAEVIKLFNSLRAMHGGDIPMSDSFDDGLPSDAEIAKMIGSKEYMDGDPAVTKKVDELLTRRQQAGRPDHLVY